jgi:hypothetical protein
MIAIVDPQHADTGWWAMAMPPLWQYFSPLLKADESVAPPKGVDPRTLAASSLHSNPF